MKEENIFPMALIVISLVTVTFTVVAHLGIRTIIIEFNSSDLPSQLLFLDGGLIMFFVLFSIITIKNINEWRKNAKTYLNPK